MIKKSLSIVLVSSLLISACGILPEWIGGEDDEKKLSGERIAVIEPKSNLALDKTLLKKEVVIPEAEKNSFFSDEGYQEFQNLSFPKKVTNSTVASEGKASPRGFLIEAAPVIADGKVFILDGSGEVFAHDATNIKKILWRVKTAPKNNFLSGGIAYENGKIFVTSAAGDIICLSAANGTELWRRKVSMPIKSSPSAKDGRVLFITSDNQLYVLSQDGGRTLWNHAGIATNIGILGSATPTLAAGLVIVPYSSGEIYAIRPENGKIIWSESLNSKKSNNSSAFALSDINADPISDGKAVYIGNNQSLLTARDILTGRLIWEKEISTIKTPWLAEDYIYLLNTDNEVISIEKKTGGVRWVVSLQNDKSKKNSSRASWQGPIMAGGRLLLTNSDSEMVFLSPDNGAILEKTSIIKNAYLRPAVANDTIYILNNDSKLAAYR